jgi:toxin ParE1/3/4
MNRRILIHEDASLDLQEHCNYLAQNNRDSAFQFFDAARQTFAALARMPGMGNLYESEEEIVNGEHPNCAISTFV